MAIRDRVTVHTRDGRDLSIVVAKQGGSIFQMWPRTKGEDLEVRLLDKNGGEVGESIRVPMDNVASVVTDSVPRGKK